MIVLGGEVGWVCLHKERGLIRPAGTVGREERREGRHVREENASIPAHTHLSSRHTERVDVNAQRTDPPHPAGKVLLEQGCVSFLLRAVSPSPAVRL